jgi:hypothetical protein
MKKIVLLILLSFSIGVNAQVKDLGGPISWRMKSAVSSVSPISLPSFDLVQYIEEDAINDITKDTTIRKFEYLKSPLFLVSTKKTNFHGTFQKKQK